MELPDNLKKLINKKNLLLLAAGLMLILALRPLFPKKQTVDTGTSVPAEQISRDFESDLEDILSEIKGVKNAKVLLTYRGSAQYIFAEDISETQSQDRVNVSRKTVIAGGEAVARGTLFPEISGAVVVYTGVNSSAVKLQLLEAVQAATGLASNKITVLPG